MLLYHSIPGTVPNVMEITGDITLVFRYVAFFSASVNTVSFCGCFFGACFSASFFMASL